MKRTLFVRNIDAREYLDMFFVAAVASILLLRLYLHLTGYPAVGGGSYHIAHMLWGGILMLAAFVMNFAFLGRHVQRAVALLGGVGFGIFIDEVGKFVTKDNDYFFRPAVGIIYAVFVLLYLLISYLTRTQKLRSEEYQLNVLRQLEEIVYQDMDAKEWASARSLLEQSKRSDPLTKQLLAILDESVITQLPEPGYVARLRHKFGSWYEQLWKARRSHVLVRWFFVVETVAFLVAVSASLYTNLDDVQDFFRGHADYGHSLVIGQFGATLFAMVFVFIGLRYLAGSRLRAFEWFRTATLINLLLTEFFLFSRIQFGAIPSFVFNLGLFALLNAVISYERHSKISD